MNNYKTFDEMFNDDKIVSPQERQRINFLVSLIGKKMKARKKKGTFQHNVIVGAAKQPVIARTRLGRAKRSGTVVAVIENRKQKIHIGE